MKRVVIESPYAGKTPGEIRVNVDYARRCVRDCLARGESPYASHLFFTQPGVLDDTVPEERKQGIEAGFAWGEAAHVVAVYIDRGISEGMRKGVARAHAAGQPVELRTLEGITITKEHAELLGITSMPGAERCVRCRKSADFMLDGVLQERCYECSHPHAPDCASFDFDPDVQFGSDRSCDCHRSKAAVEQLHKASKRSGEMKAKQLVPLTWRGQPVAEIVSAARSHMADLRECAALTPDTDSIVADVINALAAIASQLDEETKR